MQIKPEGSIKREHIVEAAIKRFSHFGINKTTLADIADDIGISKPSLYYYFQDKSSLLDSIGKRLVDEFLEALDAGLKAAKSTDEGLLSLVEIKRHHFKKYLLLAVQADSIEAKTGSAKLADFISEAQEKMKMLLSAFLKKGIEQKKLHPTDTDKTSLLLIEILASLEFTIKHKTPVLDSKAIDGVFDKQTEVIQLILNGLKIGQASKSLLQKAREHCKK